MSKIVKQGQSFLDKTIQHTGGIENALEMAILNGMSITEELNIGVIVEPSPVRNIRVVNQYKTVDEPATNATIEFVDEIDELGIGAMAIGSTFIVR